MESTEMFPWTASDLDVVKELGLFVTAAITAADFADWLFDYSMDNEGPILAAAMHAAAEATTCGVVDDATERWLDLWTSAQRHGLTRLLGASESETIAPKALVTF